MAWLNLFKSFVGLTRHFFCGLIICFTQFIPTELFAQRVSTVVGGTGDNGLAINADLFGATSVAVDGVGNIYIADAASRTIRKVDKSSGNITRFAGTGATGSSGDDGLATLASFGEPSGVAVDKDGNVFVADQLYSNIRRIDAVTGIITRIAGDPGGASGFTSDNALAIGARLSMPHSVTVDKSGNIYIADSGNQRIRKIDYITKIITTIAGNGTAGFSGDGGSATSASLFNPSDVAVDDNGNVYIADFQNHRVRLVNATTRVISTLAGNGTQNFSGDSQAANLATLNSPSGVLIDKNGNLIIADTYNQRLRKVDMNTGIISTLAGSGTSGWQDGALLVANFNVPQDVAMDSDGNLYISEYVNRRIRKISGSTISTIVGNGGFYGDGGLAKDATLRSPYGVALDSKGNLYVADLLNNRIRLIDSLTQIITTVAGNSANQYSGDGGQASNASLFWPRSIVFDSDENMYIADAANHRIRKIDKSTGVITTLAGDGNASFSGDGGLAINASIYNPHGLAFDSNGNLYFVDTGNNRVRRIDKVTGIITTVAGNGTAGYSGDGDLAISASLNYPTRITFDKSANIYVADMLNSRIRKIDGATKIISTIAGNGTGSDNGPALNAMVQFPVDVLFDNEQNLLVLEASRIRKINSITGIITTIAGTTSGYFGDGGSAALAAFKFMTNFVMDKKGNLFIADSENNRIRKIKAREPQQITFIAPEAKTYGNAPFSLEASSTSGLTVSFFSSNINVASINNDVVTIVGAGNTTITASQAGDLDFLPAAIKSQPLTINRAEQTLTFETIPIKKYGDLPFQLRANSNVGLTISFTSNNQNIATITGDVVTIKGSGTATITATQSGNTNYLPATKEQELKVEKGSQSITFNSIPDRVLTNSPFNLSATASSGLPVTYTSNSDKIQISGSLVTTLKPGKASITASQNGNSNYETATTVDKSFCINPPKPVITISFLASGEFALTSNETQGLQWFNNDILLSAETQSTIIAKKEGLYTVQSTVENCKSELSDPTVKIITSLKNEAHEITASPNPFIENLMVTVPKDLSTKWKAIIKDQNGRIVTSQQFTASDSGTLDLSILPVGLYLIEIIGSNYYYVSRVVKE